MKLLMPHDRNEEWNTKPCVSLKSLAVILTKKTAISFELFLFGLQEQRIRELFWPHLPSQKVVQNSLIKRFKNLHRLFWSMRLREQANLLVLEECFQTQIAKFSKWKFYSRKTNVLDSHVLLHGEKRHFCCEF